MREKISYSVKIVNSHTSLQRTLLVFRDAVASLTNIVNSEWNNFEHESRLNELSFIDKLIHSTANNVAKYSFFDEKFYKMPAYMRRSVRAAVLEAVKAYRNSSNEKKTLCRRPDKFPCLYRSGTFKLLDDTHCEIKVFNGHDWVWETFQLRASDVNYVKRKGYSFTDCSAPVLKKSGRGFKLVFLFEEVCELPDEISRICAIDLGINTDAVCSIIEADGTVKARKFINLADEKDQLQRLLNNIKRRQNLGSRTNSKLWRFVNNTNKTLSIKVAKAIVEFAAEQDCHCIVFEHLDTQDKKRGSKRQRLAMWRKAEIQRMAQSMAHRKVMRLSRVFAKGTSMYAFDGSGKTKRHRDNFSICMFESGKQYNCDLSASYNIGARYFIRAAQKSMSEAKWQSMVAKVPSLGSRTTCTLSSLLSLYAVM